MTNTFGITARASRFYEDDGAENAATALGSEVTTGTDGITRFCGVNTDLVLRYGVQESGTGTASGASTDDYQLQYSRNGGAFTNVTTSSTHVQAFSSSNLTDAGATTQRLSAGTGSFVAGEISEDGLIDDWALTANNFSELLYTIRVVASAVAESDTLDFRVLRNGSVFNTYSMTPRVTVTKIASSAGSSSSAITSSGAGASTAAATGTSSSAITSSGAGASTAAATGTSAAAITVVGVSPEPVPDPLARWWIDEASSGQSPTALLDSEASPVDLAITYVSGNPAYTSDSEGKGLNFTTIDDDTAGAFSAALSGGNKIFDAVDGATKCTLVVKANVPTELSGGTEPDIIFLFGIFQFDGENDPLGIWYDGQVPAFEIDSSGSGGYAHHRYDNVTSGMHVLAFVYDSTQGTAVDRMRLYMDGDLLTSFDPVTTVGANSTLDIPTGTDHHVHLGGCKDFALVGGSWKGAIKYAAIFDDALTAEQVADLSAELATADDPPAAEGAGASSVVVSASGAGASTAEATGASSSAITGSGAGSSTAAADGTSSATLTAAGAGASTAASDGASTAAVTGSGAGASTAEAAGTSSSTVTGAGEGASTAEATGTSSAALTAAGVGASTAEAAGTSSMVVTVDGDGEVAGSVASGDGTSALALTGAGAGASTAAADGASSADLTASGEGASTAAAGGAASAAVSVAAAGASTVAGDGLSSCVVSVTGAGASTAAATGTSSSTITVVGDGTEAGSGIESGIGSASVACTVIGAGAATAASDGASTATVACVGAGAATTAAAGTSTCAVAVAGSGHDVHWADGLAVGVVTAAGAGASIAAAAGTCAVAVTGAGAATSTAESSATSALAVAVAGVSGSVIPPDPPVVSRWLPVGSRPTAGGWTKASAPKVIAWTKNEDEQLPTAA